jgi:hypothetical protein
MMETDLECPCCHSSAARATAAAPGPFTNPSGMAKLLPIFGGAIGGLAYAALTSSSGNAPASYATGPRRSSSRKWIVGLFLALGGGLFLVMALVHFVDTWKIAHREPKVVTAAELRGTKTSESPPGAWIAFTFEESKPTQVTVTRRLGHGGDVKARCLLVRVEDKWLLASVAPGFEGNRLVGRLRPLDSPPSQLLSEKVEGIGPAALLAYEFNAVDGCPSDQRQRYLRAASYAALGLLGLLLGLWLFRASRRPQPSTCSPATT